MASSSDPTESFLTRLDRRLRQPASARMGSPSVVLGNPSAKLPRWLQSGDSAFRWALKHTDIQSDLVGRYKERQLDEYRRLAFDYRDLAGEIVYDGQATIYRAIRIDYRNEEDVLGKIDFRCVGKAWSAERKAAGVQGMVPVGSKSGKDVVLTGVVDAKHIDWEYGFTSFLYYSDQWEISLKQNSPILITEINDRPLAKPIAANTGTSGEVWAYTCHEVKRANPTTFGKLEIFYRLHWLDTPPFSTENAWSVSWGHFGVRGYRRKRGYSAMRSAEALASYFTDHWGSIPRDDQAEVIVFEGREIGWERGDNREPLVMPERVISRFPPSRLPLTKRANPPPTPEIAGRVYCYHAAPPEVRAKIKKSGLLPGKRASYGPPGVYLFRHSSFAEDYRYGRPFDVWRVDVTGLSLHPDPEDPSAAVYSLIPIGPERVVWTGTFLDGQETKPRTSSNPPHMGDLPVNTQAAEALKSFIESEGKRWSREYKRATGHQQWQVVPAARLIRIWDETQRLGFVRDEKGLERIVGLVLRNIARLWINSVLLGMGDYPEARLAAEMDLPYEALDDIADYVQDDQGKPRITDTGFDRLLTFAAHLLATSDHHRQMILVDHILQVTHPRGDMAANFVEGGKQTLDALFAVKEQSSGDLAGKPPRSNPWHQTSTLMLKVKDR